MNQQHDASLHRAMEWAAIAGFVSLWLFGVVDTHEHISAMSSSWLWIPAAFLGYVLCDLASGVAHWAGDRYGTPTTPVLGPNFVKPFREHHVQPRAICDHDFAEVNGNNCIVSLPFLAVAIFWFPASLVFAKAVVLAMCMAGFMTNQFHKWSHALRPPALVRVLQRLHLILPPVHHDVHHTPPHDTYYCITTGWLNRPLAAVRFWTAMEWVLWKVFGARVSEPAARTGLAQASPGAGSALR